MVRSRSTPTLLLLTILFLAVARTLLYPITAILGPFFNDAIGRSMTAGAMGGLGTLGELCNSCESRKLEEEADVVGLRSVPLSLLRSHPDPWFPTGSWRTRVSTLDTLSISGSSVSPLLPRRPKA